MMHFYIRTGDYQCYQLNQTVCSRHVLQYKQLDYFL